MVRALFAVMLFLAEQPLEQVGVAIPPASGPIRHSQAGAIRDPSCCFRDFAVHDLLTDVGIDIPGDALFLFGGERRGGQLGGSLLVAADAAEAYLRFNR
jgi:hypothetical protein